VFVGIQNLPLFAAQCFFAKQGLDVEKHGSRC
jgi:hypothetical protein